MAAEKPTSTTQRRRTKRVELPTLGGASDALQPIQRRLNAAGARLPIDGKFTPRMRRAIERFQTEHDLAVTGELDEATLGELA